MIDFKSKVQGSILNLDSCKISDQDILGIVKFIGENPQINTLNLGYNQIGAEGAEHIAASQTLQNQVDHATLQRWVIKFVPLDRLNGSIRTQLIPR